MSAGSYCQLGMGLVKGVLTFPELTVHLSSKDMEKIGGSRHVGDLHIAVLMLAFELVWRWEDPRIFVTELQISFHSTRRVLGTLTIISVR